MRRAMPLPEFGIDFSVENLTCARKLQIFMRPHSLLQFESEAQASRQLLWLSAGVIIAIFFILSTAFGSSRDGLLIVPIALSAGEPGSEIQAPMAMVIMFGLLSSTALNMIVVPILYERFGRPVVAPLADATQE
jgi:Cu/Ag efflux pump CusA